MKIFWRSCFIQSKRLYKVQWLACLFLLIFLFPYWKMVLIFQIFQLIFQGLGFEFHKHIVRYVVEIWFCCFTSILFPINFCIFLKFQSSFLKVASVYLEDVLCVFCFVFVFLVGKKYLVAFSSSITSFSVLITVPSIL